MITIDHINLFNKYLKVGKYAFGSPTQNPIVSDKDKEIYWEIYQNLLQSFQSIIKDQGFSDKFYVKAVSHNKDSGIRGHRPKDLWCAIRNINSKAFNELPQIYAIVSHRGFEVGFAVSIAETDYSNKNLKEQNRNIIPLIHEKLPTEGQIINRLNELLGNDNSVDRPNWCFNEKTRLIDSDKGFAKYNNVKQLFSDLKDQDVCTGGGAISLTFNRDYISNKPIDIAYEIKNALNIFSEILIECSPNKKANIMIKNNDNNKINFWVEKTSFIDNGPRPSRLGTHHKFGSDFKVGAKLWSPTKLYNKNGSEIKLYEKMKEVRPGDLVFHMIKGKAWDKVYNETLPGLMGISVVKNKYKLEKNINNFPIDEYSGQKNLNKYNSIKKDGVFIVDLEGLKLVSPILNRDHYTKKENELIKIIDKYRGKIINGLASKVQLFYTSKLNFGEGGYLTNMPRELANIFNDIYLDEFNTNLPYFNNDWKDNSSDIESEDKIVVKNMEEYPNNIIFYGPPGTGKTFHLRNNILPNYQGRSKFIAFHQSYAYEDFVEGIRPKVDKSNNQIIYKIINGPLKQICKQAENDPNNRYALIIDEINRGNISKIFGELITLIEDDKRVGEDQEIKIQLPYSHETFGVPKNIDFYGTMNTADKSIALLDTALRRRFDFKEIRPDPTLLRKRGNDGNGNINHNINLAELLDALNKRINILQSSEHEIGHSFFWHVKNFDQLKDVFKKKIIPQLKEYFYDDWRKIQLVFNDLTNEETTHNNAIIKAVDSSMTEIFGFDPDGYEDKDSYEVSDITPASIIKIYKND